jgi:glucan phosphoethanolaminetransferase (alkaline phosphatase superfamily)
VPLAVAVCWGVVRVSRAITSFMKTNGLRSREDLKRFFDTVSRPMKSTVRVYVAVWLASWAALFLLVLLGEAAGVK